jgi:hypothetical protein
MMPKFNRVTDVWVIVTEAYNWYNAFTWLSYYLWWMPKFFGLVHKFGEILEGRGSWCTNHYTYIYIYTRIYNFFMHAFMHTYYVHTYCHISGVCMTVWIRWSNVLDLYTTCYILQITIFSWTLDFWPHCSSHWTVSQSQSHTATDGQSVSKSWCRTSSGAQDQIFIIVWHLRSCFCGAPSLTRGRVCLLYMLLVLARAVFSGLSPMGLATIFYCLTFETMITMFPHRNIHKLIRNSGGLLWTQQ